MTISKQCYYGILDVVETLSQGYSEYVITADIKTSEIGNYASCLNQLLQDEEMDLLTQFVFLPSDTEKECLSCLQQQPWSDCTILLKEKETNAERIGIQAVAVSKSVCKTVALESNIAMKFYEDDSAQYAYITCTSKLKSDAYDEIQSVYHNVVKLLETLDFELSDVIRTWFYISDIFKKYPDFNAVRNGMFHDHKVFDSFMPASTGIGLSNCSDSSMACCFFAIKSKNDNTRVTPLTSPLQCSAFDYQVAFSRGIEIATSSKNIYGVSGTASIDGDGNTIHDGDFSSQVLQTFDVVRAILDKYMVDYMDMTRGIMYLRENADRNELQKHCLTLGVPLEKFLIVQSDVCRSDLLFEVELDLVKELA